MSSSSFSFSATVVFSPQSVHQCWVSTSIPQTASPSLPLLSFLRAHTVLLNHADWSGCVVMQRVSLATGLPVSPWGYLIIIALFCPQHIQVVVHGKCDCKPNNTCGYLNCQNTGLCQNGALIYFSNFYSEVQPPPTKPFLFLGGSICLGRKIDLRLAGLMASQDSGSDKIIHLITLSTCRSPVGEGWLLGFTLVSSTYYSVCVTVKV